MHEEPRMKTLLVVTITCPDRPGIVERITQVVVRHSANWEDSRMARLGGDFAGIVMISVAADDAEALKKSLLQLGDKETTVSVKVTQADTSRVSTQQAFYEIRLTGADHEGIVHKVSTYLAGQGINVESMETRVSRAPMSAAPLFHMSALLKVPAGVAAESLADGLRQIGESLGVDIELLPAGH
jgi:glycine cleavage system regulatory protein